MEKESNPMQTLCRGGCGFYGNSSTDGFCSVCYKEDLKKKNQPPNPPPPTSSPTTNTVVTTDSIFTTTNCTEPIFPQIPMEISDINFTAEPPISPVPMTFSDAIITEPPSSPIPIVSSKILESNVENNELGGESSGAQAASKEPDSETEAGLETSSYCDDKHGKAKNKNRCVVCHKKVGLTGFECRCGGLYCGIHRYSDKHNCTFNYRELGAEEIRRNNPVVRGEKIQKF